LLVSLHMLLRPVLQMLRDINPSQQLTVIVQC
ncbi:hypothetical protein ACTFIW_007517, partial [Dictyostelium discoideum]